MPTGNTKLSIQMKHLFALLFFMLAIQLNAEELFVINLDNCLDSSTHIIQGEVKNDQGLIEVKKLLKGQWLNSTITIDVLPRLNKYGHYSPKEKVGWEVILFLRKDANGILQPIKFFNGQLEKEYQMALSALWLKDDGVYYGTQPTIPGDIIFAKQDERGNMLQYIIEYTRVQKKIKKIHETKSCRKRVKRLAREYYETEVRHLVYKAISSADCPRAIKKFQKKSIRNDGYGSMERSILRNFIELAGEKEIDKIFRKEFDFWQQHLKENEKDKFWEYRNERQDRFLFFESLMYAIVHTKKGAWEMRCREVVNYFDQLIHYRDSEVNMKLHEILNRKLLEEK